MEGEKRDVRRLRGRIHQCVARVKRIERRNVPLSSTTTVVGGRAFVVFSINWSSIVCFPAGGSLKVTLRGAHTRSVQNEAMYPRGTWSARKRTADPGTPCTCTANFAVPGTLPGRGAPAYGPSTRPTARTMNDNMLRSYVLPRRSAVGDITLDRNRAVRKEPCRRRQRA